jgi:hypothetical protein
MWNRNAKVYALTKSDSVIRINEMAGREENMGHPGAIWAALTMMAVAVWFTLSLRRRNTDCSYMILCTHLATRSLPHRLTGLLLIPALMLSVPLLLPIAQAQQQRLPSSPTCSPQVRTITVWKVGSPYENGAPSKTISAELKLRAKSLGCTIQVEVFPAVGFADSFFAAFQKHQEPDVLVVENKGVISGITMRSGESINLAKGDTIVRSPAAIEGIASNEAIFRALEAVPRSLASLDDARSWEFLLRTSRNHNAARLLALRSPDCELNRVVASIPGDLLDFVQAVLPAYLGGTAAVKSYDDADRLNTVITDPWAYQLGQTKVCGFWGTNHLVFVQTDSTFQDLNSLARIIRECDEI